MSDKEVFEYHGWEEQCKHITSEMHELTSAIQKYELLKETQNPLPLWNHICEELEDVQFMLNQIKEYYSIEEKNTKAWGDYKRKREHKRIKEGYYEKKNE
jgi:NTP pyrophosphatase (non-canonical NTP hydrolase)